MHLRLRFAHDPAMQLVLLGIGLGFLTLVPPGPVSLTLVQIAIRAGRRSALHGALGIAGGDTVLGLTAAALVGLGSALPRWMFEGGQVVSALLLVGLGLAIARRPQLGSAAVDRIHRPGRALFLLTSLTPTALGAWIALLAAMPFATDVTQLALFTIGVLIASALWHPVLGSLAASLGSRLSTGRQARLTRAGGVAMAGLGATLVLPWLA